MIFTGRDYGRKSGHVFSNIVSEAVQQLIPAFFKPGWKTVRVFESTDRKSAIVISADNRPFIVEQAIK